MENLLKGSSELNKMFAGVQRTGAGLRRDFGEVENLQQSITGARGFVKKAAERIEESILSDLTLIRPNAGILTPNYSRDGDGQSEFVLALSGAENFVRGNPNFAISCALRVAGETTVALVYSPIDDRLYYAEIDNGAFSFSTYHSAKIRVSELKDPTDLTIAYNTSDFASRARATHASRRITGCPAMDMCWVAAGKFDAFVSDPLDYAEICAGELIVNLAGGRIREMDGKIIIDNGKTEIS